MRPASVRIPRGALAVPVRGAPGFGRGTGTRTEPERTSESCRRRDNAPMTIDLTHELFDETPDAILAVHADGSVLHWNRAAEVMFGYTRDEAMGKKLTDLIVP